jgi:hypothetical protein
MRAIGGALVLLLGTSVSTRAAAAPHDVNAIEAQCAAAAKLDDAHKGNVRHYADLSRAVLPGPNDGSGKWHLYKTESEMKVRPSAQGVSNTVASVWSAPDGTTIAAMHFTSASNDRSDDVEYCFRPDGTLARAVAALVNFEAETYGHRTLWFAPDGTVLFTKEKASENGRRRKPGPDLMEGLNATIVYPTVKSLPFNAPASAPPATKKAVAAAPSNKLAPPLPAKAAHP